MTPARALVTGASGFVGANVLRRLARDDIETHAAVHTLDGTWRLAGIAEGVCVHTVDITDAPACDALLQRVRPDWVIHCAAHGAYSWETNMREILATNVLGTAALLEASARTGVSAFVHTGSSSEYGFKDHAPDEADPVEPTTAYAVGKAAATLLCSGVASAMGLRAVTLRLYSVYGPWEEPRRLMPQLVAAASNGQLPPLVDPLVARDFVHVDDVCEAIIVAAARGGAGAVYNVGSGVQTTLAELVELVRARFGVLADPQWSTMERRVWDTHTWVADPSRIEAELGWKATTALEDGLWRFAEWMAADPDRQARYRTA